MSYISGLSYFLFTVFTSGPEIMLFWVGLNHIAFISNLFFSKQLDVIRK